MIAPGKVAKGDVEADFSERSSVTFSQDLPRWYWDHPEPRHLPLGSLSYTLGPALRMLPVGLDLRTLALYSRVHTMSQAAQCVRGLVTQVKAVTLLRKCAPPTLVLCNHVVITNTMLWVTTLTSMEARGQKPMNRIRALIIEIPESYLLCFTSADTARCIGPLPNLLHLHLGLLNF